MYSVLVGKSRTPASSLSHHGHVSKLSQVPFQNFLPTCEDINKMKVNLVTIVSQVLTWYVSALNLLSKAIPRHITHQYSTEMSKSQRWWY